MAGIVTACSPLFEGPDRAPRRPPAAWRGIPGKGVQSRSRAADVVREGEGMQAAVESPFPIRTTFAERCPREAKMRAHCGGLRRESAQVFAVVGN